MKATGVIRRIDDLGRIVIPKEIRKNLRIRVGENLEIYVNNKKVSLEKGIQVYKGDEVKISFNLSYKDNASAESLLKTTRYITYANKNGEECVFADAQGFMVINYIDDAFIKQYIDNKLRK